jgi:methionine synthase II (cobalamin-independent)
MFATLLGALPRPPLPDDAAQEAVLDAMLALQVENGLEPVTDGGVTLVPDDPVASWRATAARTDRLVKAIVSGPYGVAEGADERVIVAALRETVADLAAAGCRWIEVHEPAAVSIGSDPASRARFAELHRTLTADLGDVHLSLAITGGDAAAAGIETILAGTYASLALDLIDGPDNWRLVAATPGDRGVVCGAMGAGERADEGPEVLLWAAGYAASTGGRGAARVGLATAASLAGLPWTVAERRVQRLGEAARLAAAPREERLRAIDPRAIDARSAALGRYAPRARRRRGRPSPPAH